MAPFLKRAGDSDRRFLLLKTEREVLCLRQRAVLRKKRADTFNKITAQAVLQCDHDIASGPTACERRKTQAIIVYSRGFVIRISSFEGRIAILLAIWHAPLI